MSASNPFQHQRADLGSLDIGISQQDAFNSLQSSYNNPSDYKCYICQQPSKHRIIPKLPQLANAELQKGMYICEHHIRENVLNSEHYGLRPIS